MGNRPPSDHERIRLIEQSLEYQRQIDKGHQAEILKLIAINEKKTTQLEHSRYLILGIVVAIIVLIFRVDARLNLYGQEIAVQTGISDAERSWILANADEVIPILAVLAGLYPSIKAYRQKQKEKSVDDSPD